MIPSQNFSAWPLWIATFHKTPRTRKPETWQFYAIDEKAAREYVVSRPGYENAKIIGILEVPI